MTALPQTSPSDSFVELCSFIAIRQAQDSEEVIRQLVLRAFVFESGQRFARASDFADVIQTRFGLRLPENRLQSSIDRLINTGSLVRQHNRDIAISTEAKANVERDMTGILDQEGELRAEWLLSVHQISPDLPDHIAWTTLVSTLRKLFRRHGLQTINLLDSTLSLDDNGERGVRGQVRESCSAPELKPYRDDLEAAILAFLHGAHADSRRAAYIARLADSMVSYLSLTVSPEVADKLRRKLQPLDVFLDTNILFGLIGLAEPETTAAAREFAFAVQEHQLPLELRFHEDTEQELRRTFDGLSVHLRSRVWPPAISAAAVRAKNINTVARLYHERNSMSAISADTFLQPYEHVDIIIRERGAIPYREVQGLPKQEVYDLLADFRTFLEKHQRDKPYEAIAHDVTLLLTVRRLRVAARSSLDTRAILVTNDVMLHLFEKQAAKRERRPPCTLLLRQLLQLLRPFIPTTVDFDISFAETFAAPEFRAIDSKAAIATSKLLELLAAYKDMTEETAAALLTNDMLLGKLQSEADQKGMAAMVDSALAIENASLQAERDTLAASLERSEAERERRMNDAISTITARFERDKLLLQEEHTDLVLGRETVVNELAQTQQTLDQLTSALEAERVARENAERTAKTLHAEVLASTASAQRRQRGTRISVAMLLSFVVAVGIEYSAFWGYLPWLATHQQSYSLRACAYLALSLGFVGYARPDLRKTVWSAGVLPLIFILVQLLGGPGSEPDSSPPSPSGTTSNPSSASSSDQ